MEKYDNLGMVGEGSYGMVMKCKHKETGQIVAIKKFLESEDDKMVKKIAMREVRMLRKLRHENLVNLIEVFRRRKRLYLVFEYVDHTVLDDLEKYPNGLSEMTVRKILWQVLRGVEFCHSHNIIHRDIKPENILNSRSGVIKICDFGFARTLAAPGEIYTDYVATRWYRAPELLVGDTKYGRAIDIWAIGCLVGEMLYGDPIFPGKSDIDQLNRILKCVGNLCPRHREIFQRNPLFAGMRLPDVRDIEPLERKFPKFSSEVLDLMKQCLRLDPNDRPSSSLLLRHEYFKKDGFEEKVIPDLRARISKDNANNLLARKEAIEKKEQEKRKKKLKELAQNNSADNKDVNIIQTNKSSPDHKNLANKQLQKINTPSPKKENQTKSNKTNINSTSNQNKSGNNSVKEKKSHTKIDTENQLPSVAPLKQSGKREQTPPNSHKSILKQTENAQLQKNIDSMPNIAKKSQKYSNKDSPRTSIEAIPTTNSNGILKTPPSQKRANDLKLEKKQELKQKTPKDVVTKTSSDLNITKEKQTRSSERLQTITPPNLLEKQNKNKEKSPKNVDYKQVQKSPKNLDSKQVQKSPKALEKQPHKSPKNLEKNSRNMDPRTLGPLTESLKRDSPDLSIVNSTASPHSMFKHKQLGGAVVKSFEKDKTDRSSQLKKNELSSLQSSFDKNMYPDKTSHFEKMMMSMSGATSITHPAIKKNIPTNQHVSFNTNPAGSSSMAFHYSRHKEEKASNNLPLWTSGANNDDFSMAKQSSSDVGLKITLDSKHKNNEDRRYRDKSPKQKKEGKVYHHTTKDKSHRDSKPDNLTTHLPDLGQKPYLGVLQERDHLKTSGIDPPKAKKTKHKTMLMAIPSLDPHITSKHAQKSRSPSPTNNHHSESNFPSVHHQRK